MDRLPVRDDRPAGPARKRKLLDQVRDAIRTRHMSLRMGPVEITQFLTALAVDAT